jgi:hypothetical protein
MDRTFDAFLSYSHKNERVARKIGARLRRYRPPKSAGLGRRRLSIFRDTEQLTAGADLSQELVEHLEQSDRLVLLCSPEAAASDYVNSEAAWFKSHRGLEALLFVLLEGEWADVAPKAVRGQPGEPLFIDLRDAGYRRFRRETLRLIAALYGVDFETLYRQDASRRRRWRQFIVAAAVSAVLVLVSAYLVVTTDTEVWARVAQPHSTEDLMPVHDFAVNRQDPDIVLFKGVSARWATNPRPQGYWLKPEPYPHDLEREIREKVESQGRLMPAATLEFDTARRQGHGRLNVYAVAETGGKAVRFIHEFALSYTADDGMPKALSFPPRLLDEKADPFDLGRWVGPQLERAGLWSAGEQLRGSLRDHIGNRAHDVDYAFQYRDEGYDEWVEIWGPHDYILSTADSDSIEINGLTLTDIENDDDAWDAITEHGAWLTPLGRPGYVALGQVYGGGEEDIAAAIKKNLGAKENDQALLETLKPLFRHELGNISLLRVVVRGVKAEILRVAGFDDSPEFRGVERQPEWLFRLGESGQWHQVRLPLRERLTEIVQIIPLDGREQAALIATTQGVFRTRDGGISWEDLNQNEPALLQGDKLKFVLAGEPAAVYVLADRYDQFGQGENPLFRFMERSWFERWRAGLVRVLI